MPRLFHRRDHLKTKLNEDRNGKIIAVLNIVDSVKQRDENQQYQDYDFLSQYERDQQLWDRRLFTIVDWKKGLHSYLLSI